MMRYLLALSAMFLGFTGSAWAASSAADAVSDGSLSDMIGPILEAVKGGNGWLAAALGVILAVTALRRYGAGRWPILASKKGAAVCNVALSFAGAAATAIAAGAAPSLALAFTATKVAIAAGGGYTLIKELVAPMILRLEGVLPGWLSWAVKPLSMMVSWLADSKQAAVAKAEAAGKAAVAAKPATGLSSVVDTEDLR